MSDVSIEWGTSGGPLRDVAVCVGECFACIDVGGVRVVELLVENDCDVYGVPESSLWLGAELLFDGVRDFTVLVNFFFDGGSWGCWWALDDGATPVYRPYPGSLKTDLGRVDGDGVWSPTWRYYGGGDFGDPSFDPVMVIRGVVGVVREYFVGVGYDV